MSLGDLTRGRPSKRLQCKQHAWVDVENYDPIGAQLRMCLLCRTKQRRIADLQLWRTIFTDEGRWRKALADHGIKVRSALWEEGR